MAAASADGVKKSSKSTMIIVLVVAALLIIAAVSFAFISMQNPLAPVTTPTPTKQAATVRPASHTQDHAEADTDADN